ncbi:MAG: WD40 repeat domain-containing protein [Anaerolineae bacterium]
MTGLLFPKKIGIVLASLLLIALNRVQAQETVLLPELETISFENADRLHEVAVLESTAVQHLAWSQDSRNLAVVNSSGLTLYTLEDRVITARFLAEGNFFATGIAFSPDNTILATAEASSELNRSILKYWDADDRTLLREFEYDYPSLSGILFSPSGLRLIARITGQDISASVVFLDVTTGEEISHVSYPWPVTNMMLSPDDSALIYGVGNAVYDNSHNYLYSITAWVFDDAYTGHPLDLGVHLGGFQDIDSPFDGTYFIILLSPDGTLLAARPNEGHDTLWDVASGEQLATLPDNLRFDSFLLDGTLVVSDSTDNTVRLWRPDEDQMPLIFDNENIQWLQSYLSPDGKVLAVSTYFDIIRLYGVPTE